MHFNLWPAKCRLPTGLDCSIDIFDFNRRGRETSRFYPKILKIKLILKEGNFTKDGKVNLGVLQGEKPLCLCVTRQSAKKEYNSRQHFDMKVFQLFWKRSLSLPFSLCLSLSFFFKDCVQLNQYKLKDEIGKVPWEISHWFLFFFFNDSFRPLHVCQAVHITKAVTASDFLSLSLTLSFSFSAVLVSQTLCKLAWPWESWKMDERLL